MGRGDRREFRLNEDELILVEEALYYLKEDLPLLCEPDAVEALLSRVSSRLEAIDENN